MKKKRLGARFVVAILAAGLISGCANQQQVAHQKKVEEVDAFKKENTPNVDKGAMKRSDYWIGVYDVVSSPPVSANDVAFMHFINEAIATAKLYEKGAISLDAYSEHLRELNTEFQRTQLQNQADAEREQQERNRQALALYLKTKPVTTNCIGGTGYASCTSY